MLTRRSFMGAPAAGLAATALGACAGGSEAYREAAEAMRRPLPPDADSRELIRFATLAANGHNSQPWRFRVGDRRVDILPDFARRTPAVDPDDHHLFASLGCAAQNLSLAARARAKSGEVRFDPSGAGSLQVDLETAPRRESELFAAIPARQCSRAPYDARPVSTDVLARLEAAVAPTGVEILLVTAERRREDILALVVEGNSRQMDDPAFVAELKDWIRFNPAAALAARDGLYTGASGNPSLPDWLGPLVFGLFFTKQAENDKYAEQIRSSAGLAVFVAPSDDRRGWCDAGRAYQSFALRATVEGLKTAFLNQAVEVPEVRDQLRSMLGLGARRPNLVVRFGYGPDMPRSLRRPPGEVVV